MYTMHGGHRLSYNWMTGGLAPTCVYPRERLTSLKVTPQGAGNSLEQQPAPPVHRAASPAQAEPFLESPKLLHPTEGTLQTEKEAAMSTRLI